MSDDVVLRLTRKQAAFLHALLNGYIEREAGCAMKGTPHIIRNVINIGKRLSKAAGFNWWKR